jgi:TatD DNase family protein
MLWTVDAHCHWSDPRLFDRAGWEIPRLIEAGVRGFQLGGVDPEDWRRQTELQGRFPGRFWRSFGLHPYFVASQPEEQLNRAFQQLTRESADVEALGEMGLDFRTPFLGAGKDIQTRFFKRQLELAGRLGKPVVLHIVRAHEEALHELRDHQLSGMVHAFTAGPRVAKRYLDSGYHLSIGAALLRPEAAELAKSVSEAPLERLLIESDCPDQAPPGQKAHDSATVWLVARRMAELKKLPLERIVEQTRANLLQLINRELREA